MQQENCTTIILSDKDVRLVEVNAGLTVELPPATTKVIIRVERKTEEPSERR